MSNTNIKKLTGSIPSSRVQFADGAPFFPTSLPPELQFQHHFAP
jgi:hypothetical protein